MNYIRWPDINIAITAKSIPGHMLRRKGESTTVQDRFELVAVVEMGGANLPMSSETRAVRTRQISADSSDEDQVRNGLYTLMKDIRDVLDPPDPDDVSMDAAKAKR